MAKKKAATEPKHSPAPDEALPRLRLEYIDPAQLAQNPRNWRTHPESQLSALTDVISEVGWAGAALYNERTGRLIDGHARQKIGVTQGAKEIPVLIGSWTEAQEAKILATLDPIAAMAEADQTKLDELLREVETGSEALAAMLDQLAQNNGIVPGEEEEAGGPGEEPASNYREQYGVIVICDGEQHQKEVYDRLAEMGFNCKVVVT